jgi:multidrug efflux pump
MTSLATVFGVLPIALSLGAAAKSRMSMGIVIIGGLLFSLGLTLFIIPALYTYLSSQKSRIEILEKEAIEPEGAETILKSSKQNGTISIDK